MTDSIMAKDSISEANRSLPLQIFDGQGRLIFAVHADGSIEGDKARASEAARIFGESLAVSTALAMSRAQPVDTGVVIDLDKSAMALLSEAASQSSWVPPEYMANDWVSDCARFLRTGEGVTPPLDSEAVKRLADNLANTERQNGDLLGHWLEDREVEVVARAAFLSLAKPVGGGAALALRNARDWIKHQAPHDAPDREKALADADAALTAMKED